MITIHQRNQKVFDNGGTIKIHLKYTSLRSAQQIYHWLAHNSVNFEFAYLLLFFLLSTNIPLFEKFNVLLSLVVNNSPMHRSPMSNCFYVQNPVFNIPDFSTKSCQASYRKVPCVTIFFKFPFDDSIRATVQWIAYTVLQNCLPKCPKNGFLFCIQKL